VAVDLAMVTPTQWDDELIADLAPQRPALGKPQMMRIRRAATANQAGLLGHVADVLAVPNPAWFPQGQRSLVNSVGL
jgi:hypothetical protein